MASPLTHRHFQNGMLWNAAKVRVTRALRARIDGSLWICTNDVLIDFNHVHRNALICLKSACTEDGYGRMVLTGGKVDRA